MQGIIEAVHHHTNGGIGSIFICGEDGATYFGHFSNFTRKTKHYKIGRTVTFDVEDNGRAHPDAINIDVEIPANLRKQDELISIQHLRDGAYVKRILKPNGERRSLIIKDKRRIIDCFSDFERDMVWMYQRGPSGECE